MCCIPVCRSVKEAFRKVLVILTSFLIVIVHICFYCKLLITLIGPCLAAWRIWEVVALRTRARFKLTQSDWLWMQFCLDTSCWEPVRDGKAGAQRSFLWFFTNKHPVSRVISLSQRKCLQLPPGLGIHELQSMWFGQLRHFRRALGHHIIKNIEGRVIKIIL